MKGCSASELAMCFNAEQFAVHNIRTVHIKHYHLRTMIQSL
jgi:hypothetical protein